MSCKVRSAKKRSTENPEKLMSHVFKYTNLPGIKGPIQESHLEILIREQDLYFVVSVVIN